MVNLMRLAEVFPAKGILRGVEEIITPHNLIGIGKNNGLKVYKGNVFGRTTFATVNKENELIKVVQKKPQRKSGPFTYSSDEPYTTWHDLNSRGLIKKNESGFKVQSKDYKSGISSDMRVNSDYGTITFNYPDGKGFDLSHVKSEDKVYAGLSNEHINVESLGYYPEDYVQYKFTKQNGKYVSENPSDVFNFDVDKSINQVLDLFRRYRKN